MASTTLASAAVKNPIFQQAATKAVFQAVTTSDELPASSSNFNDPSALDVSDQEFNDIKRWATILRLSMIVISTLMLITAWYNILSVTSPSISSSLLAFYLTIFSLLICCFELAWRRASLLIVQNFGFMYSSIGRILFLIFVAIVSFQLSTFGKVVFALILLWGCVNIYVNVRHPKYNMYLRKLHFYNRIMARPKKQGLFSTVV